MAAGGDAADKSFQLFEQIRTIFLRYCSEIEGMFIHMPSTSECV